MTGAASAASAASMGEKESDHGAWHRPGTQLPCAGCGSAERGACLALHASSVIDTASLLHSSASLTITAQSNAVHGSVEKTSVFVFVGLLPLRPALLSYTLTHRPTPCAHTIERRLEEDALGHDRLLAENEVPDMLEVATEVGKVKKKVSAKKPKKAQQR